MANQTKNMIRALNERKFLRDVQNDFKPKIFFRENQAKKIGQQDILTKSDNADSSAHTINESVFSDDISPFSPYSPYSNFQSIASSGAPTDDDSGDSAINDLLESVTKVDDIFIKYFKFLRENENRDLAAYSAPNSPLNSPPNSPLNYRRSSSNLFSDDSIELLSLLDTDSPSAKKLKNLINSIKSDNSYKLDKSNIKKGIKNIFTKSPEEIAKSPEKEKEIKIIEIKNRVSIRKNIINGNVSKLVPLKISFFGGTAMNYDDCKKVILETTDKNINENLTKLLNTSLNKGSENKPSSELKIATIEPKDSNDMGLTQILNKSLNDSTDMGLKELLNASLSGSSIVKSINASSSGSSSNEMGLEKSLNTSSSDNQEYVIEITFDNETLEPTDIVINRAQKFKDMTDETKPSNYLFSVNQFIMEQIKTKNRGYILEGKTTMACYFKKNNLDFDTPIFTFKLADI